jgi:hypothetical protein
MITIVVKNQANVVSDAQVQAILPALQQQLDKDFCPAWGLGQFHIEFRVKSAPIAKGEWQFLFLDKTDDASALGYHDQTANGDPIAYIGVLETINDGVLWSVTASHELLEMALNPHLDDSEYNAANNRFDIKEVCDAVEADELGYKIGDVQVSDFVLPGWFNSETPPSAPLSFCGHVTRPFELAPGGYISFVDLSQPSKGWQQVFAKTEAHADRKRPGTCRGAMRVRVRELGTRRKSTAQ